ncbi:MAG: hypothetical protein ACOYD9_06980 [Pyramidobacter sp.]
MKSELIWGIPALNFQALLGVVLFAVTVLLVKLIRGIQTGKYPGSPAMLIYLRTLLWAVMIGGGVFFVGAMLGFRYI